MSIRIYFTDYPWPFPHKCYGNINQLLLSLKRIASFGRRDKCLYSQLQEILDMLTNVEGHIINDGLDACAIHVSQDRC